MFKLLIKRFLLAIRFFPSITEPCRLIENPEQLGKAAPFFPVVGFFFGILAMACYQSFSFWFGPELACFLALLVLILFYNGGRFWGCLRVADRLLITRRWTFENRKRIRLERGTFRVIFLFFILVLKFFALLHVGEGWIPSMLVLLPTVSAWSYVYLAHSIASASKAEFGPFPHIKFVGNLQFWGATFFTTAIAIFFMGLEGLFLLMFLSLGTVIFERYVVNRNKKFLGNVLGVMLESSEVGLLLVVILMRDGFLTSTSMSVLA
jgi:cobalamin synthase